MRGRWTGSGRIRATQNLLILTAGFLACGCQTTSNTQSGALLGSGLGAATGAIIGNQSGHAAGGAVIGALAGGVAGGLVGQNEDLRQERDAAVTRAQYLETSRRALTNVDVVQMIQNGLSDDVVVGAIQSQAGCYSLTPADLSSLKSNGVSDRVLIAMQRAPRLQPAPVYSSAPSGPGVIVVEPRPVFWYGPPRPYGWGPRFGPGPRCGRW